MRILLFLNKSFYDDCNNISIIKIIKHQMNNFVGKKKNNEIYYFY